MRKTAISLCLGLLMVSASLGIRAQETDAAENEKVCWFSGNWGPPLRV
ncbi:MAG: hypothetical protein Q8Q12_09790 [bacterium]|nr:hypothetical protein [bacterium]